MPGTRRYPGGKRFPLHLEFRDLHFASPVPGLTAVPAPPRPAVLTVAVLAVAVLAVSSSAPLIVYAAAPAGLARYRRRGLRRGPGHRRGSPVLRPGGRRRPDGAGRGGRRRGVHGA